MIQCNLRNWKCRISICYLLGHSGSQKFLLAKNVHYCIYTVYIQGVLQVKIYSVVYQGNYVHNLDQFLHCANRARYHCLKLRVHMCIVFIVLIFQVLFIVLSFWNTFTCAVIRVLNINLAENSPHCLI
jgi:hypothetical protein